jgi:hypothetical protein
VESLGSTSSSGVSNLDRANPDTKRERVALALRSQPTSPRGPDCLPENPDLDPSLRVHIKPTAQSNEDLGNPSTANPKQRNDTPRTVTLTGGDARIQSPSVGDIHTLQRSLSPGTLDPLRQDLQQQKS